MPSSASAICSAAARARPPARGARSSSSAVVQGLSSSRHRRVLRRACGLEPGPSPVSSPSWRPSWPAAFVGAFAGADFAAGALPAPPWSVPPSPPACGVFVAADLRRGLAGGLAPGRRRAQPSSPRAARCGRLACGRAFVAGGLPRLRRRAVARPPSPAAAVLAAAFFAACLGGLLRAWQRRSCEAPDLGRRAVAGPAAEVLLRRGAAFLPRPVDARPTAAAARGWGRQRLAMGDSVPRRGPSARTCPAGGPGPYTGCREDMIRTGPGFNPSPRRAVTHGSVADRARARPAPGAHRHGIDGTSSPARSRERPGDGVSPGGVRGAKITPEPPEEPRSAAGVEPAAPTRTKRVTGAPAGGQGGWYRGSGRQAGARPFVARPPARAPEARRRRTHVPPGTRRRSTCPRSSTRCSPSGASSDIFAALARRRPGGGPLWVFYEGPPTANGMPGTHHVEARVFKDVFPRYRTMKGYHVPRKAGWDCHGLPVELAVEKELGFAGKKRHRGVRHRGVQRSVPRVGAAARRRVRRA